MVRGLHKIAIVSGKGGVGKTTTTVNLALAMYKLGANVIVMDANITTPNLGLYLGILNTPKTLNDVLRGDIHISESIYSHNSGINIIPSDMAVDALTGIDYNQIKHVVGHLENHADFLLIDTAATLGSETQRVMELVDEIVIVTNTDKGALIDALKTIETAKRIGVPVLGVIVNRVQGRFDRSRIEELLGIPVLGHIKHDKKLSKSVEDGKIYLETYNTSNVNRYYDAASMFLGPSYRKKLLKERKSSLFDYVLKQLGLVPKN
jgi:MinD-like ATPase involved in chromosome partitioning or flagellar assembly